MVNTWNLNMADYDKSNKDGTVVTVLPIRTDSAKSLVEAAYKLSLQKRKTGCRELVESNSSLPKATPSIHLHCSTCTCAPPSPLDTSSEDASLSRKITAAAAVCRAKALTSPGSSPKLSSLAAFQSVSRWLTFTSPTSPTPTSTVADLCFAVSALDITKTARLLFDDNLPLSERNPAGVPPLIACIRSHLAATHPLSHQAMVSLLLDAGAEPNIVTSSSPAGGSMSALAAASSLGLPAIVRLLLSRGAAVDAKLSTIPMFRFSGHGLTALHVAVFADKPEAADILLSHGGADVSATFDGYRAIGSPSSSPKSSSPSPSGRRHSRVWTTGITPLHLADDSPACTSLLLRHGADALAKDGFGRTPLHWAMTSGNVGVVHLLLRAGTPADVWDDDGATPLALLVTRLESGASRAGHPDVVRMLLAAGANPDLRYPQDLSVKGRLLLMEEWRGTYEGIFERYALGGRKSG